MAENTVQSAAKTQQKRQDYLEWEQYFMGVALLSAKRSKDPKTQVGACIVNEDRIIVSTGYNGMPNGLSDDDMPWGKGDGLENKHLYVCHAELNAVMNKNSSGIKKCTTYVTLFPCNECAKLLIQGGVKEIVYLSDKHSERDSTNASKLMLENAGIKFREYDAGREEVILTYPKDD